MRMPGCDAAGLPRTPDLRRRGVFRVTALCALLAGVVACTHPAARPAAKTAGRATAVANATVPPVSAGAAAEPAAQSAPVTVIASNPVNAPAPPPAASVPPTAPVPPTTAAPAHANPGQPPARIPDKARAPVAARAPALATAAEPANAASATDARATTPTLDLTALEQRLRETHAVGLFTKLSLKNQVDDLLDQFRALYRRQAKIPPASLRQQYDLLLLKVLSLLQDGDPPLAAAIASSREAIWSILADPQKFSSI